MTARVTILRRSYLDAQLSGDAPTVEAIAAASGLAPSRWPVGDAPTLSGHEVLLRAACRVAGVPESDVAVRCHECEAERERDPARRCVTHRRAPHIPEVLQHPWDVASRDVRAELIAAETVTPRDLVRLAPERAREALEGALAASEAWARGDAQGAQRVAARRRRVHVDHRALRVPGVREHEVLFAADRGHGDDARLGHGHSLRAIQPPTRSE